MVVMEEIEKQNDTDELSLGLFLKQKRMEYGIDIETIARDTRISKRYLYALEKDDFSEMPGAAYVSGFVRAYARRLDLDEIEVVKRYRSEVKLDAPKLNFHLQEPPAESRLPSRAAVMGGIAVAVAAYSVWFSIHKDGEFEAVNQSFTPAVVAQPGPEEHKDKIAAFTPSEEGSSSTSDDVPQADDIAPSAIEAEGDALTDDAAVQEEEAPLAEAIQPEAVEERVVVEVTEDSWLHITRGDEVVFSGVLKAGGRLDRADIADAELTTGNAGGVILRVGEWSSGPLGPKGRVRRGISLNPDDWQTASNSAEHS